MAPAFANSLGRVLFCGLLAGLLTLPLVTHLGVHNAHDIYNGIDARGSIEKSHVDILFRDSDPVDVAFVGLSSLWVDINSKTLQDLLSTKEKQSTVVTLGANHPGEDLVFTLVSQLFRHREVKLLVLSAPGRSQIKPHPSLHRVLNLQDHNRPLQQLKFVDQVTVYALAVLGAPGQILNRLRVPHDTRERRGLARNNGSWIRSLGWRQSKFEPIDSIDCCISLRTVFPQEYHLLDFEDVTTQYQRTYLIETLELARRHQVMVALIVPQLWRDRRTAKPIVRLPRDLVDAYSIPIIVESGKNYFGDLSDEEIQQLYYDANHMNRNGARLYTDALVSPISELLSM